MAAFGSWMGALPALALLAAVWYLPGVGIAQILRIRGVLRLAIAPLISAVIIALGSVSAPLVGLRWNLVTFAVFAALVALIAVALRGLMANQPPLASAQIDRHSQAIALAATGALLLPFMLTVRSDDVLQQVDPTFHMNALWLIGKTGNASSFGALTALYGLDTTTTIFPAGWHAAVSLAANHTSVVVATNAMALVVCVFWVIGLLALVHSLSPKRPTLAGRYTLALIPAIIIFPTYLTTRYPPLPNALEIALLPALIAAAITFVRNAHSWRERFTYGLIWVAMCGASALIHPSVVFALALMASLPAAVLAIRRWAALVSRRAWRAMAVDLFAIVVVVVLVAAIVMTVPGVQEKLAAMGQRYRTTTGAFGASIPKALTCWPLITSAAGSGVTRALSVLQGGILLLTLAGVAALVRSVKGQLIVAAWLATALLTFTALWRSGPLLWLAGLWYMSPHRTMAIQAIWQLIVMGAGLALLTRWLQRYWTASWLPRAVAVLALVVVAGLSAPARTYLAALTYHPRADDYTFMASPAELAMIRSLDEVLPPDARVLGDPYNGSALVQAVGNREVVFPQLYFRESNVPEAVLRYQFRIFDSNQAVCNYVNEYGITHLYLDTDTESFGKDNTVEAPGLYGVDTSVGFTKVASGGSASVWRIDVCDSK